jgi:hypothetical protein
MSLLHFQLDKEALPPTKHWMASKPLEALADVSLTCLQEGDRDDDGAGEGDSPDLEPEEKPKPKKRAKKEEVPGEGSDPPKEKKRRKSKAQQKAEEDSDEPLAGLTPSKAEDSDSEDQVLAAGLGHRSRSVSEKPVERSESKDEAPTMVYTGAADYPGAVLLQPVGYVDSRVPLEYPGSQQRRLIDLQEEAEEEEEEDEEDEEEDEETDDEQTT